MNIADFLLRLQQQDELLAIDAEIDARLELAALTDLVRKREGPALLFNRVEGSNLRLITNLFGSAGRMAAALGTPTLQEFGCDLATRLAQLPEGDSAARLRALEQSITDREVPSLRSIAEENLDFLPQIRFWPAEERTFLTLAVVISRSPQQPNQNFGLYRVGVQGKRQLLLNLLPGSGGAAHLSQWRERGQPMPVAILLGADPVLIFAAAAALPAGMEENRFSALLEGSYHNWCQAATLPLRLPASGQILIEGLVDGKRQVEEGPFGCYRGDYGGGNACPVVEISAIRRVENPLLPLTLAGPLPMEDCWLARANLELVQARLRIDLPGIERLQMPLETAFHGLYFVRASGIETVADLARQLQQLGYLRPLRMLALLGDDDPDANEHNWRKLLQTVSRERIWRQADDDLDRLLRGERPRLQHDPRLVARMSDLLGRYMRQKMIDGGGGV